MSDNKNEKDLNQELDQFLGNSNNQEQEQKDCVGNECIIKTKTGLVERINKKVITEDGRQLL